jgi:site-specific DNA-cytosine methylase
MSRVLVACEESQAVTIELRALGVEAYSCDVEPCTGGHPEWHLQQDVAPLLNQHWDMILAFPPCTHLANSGAKWFEQKKKDGRQQSAIDFFMLFANASCERIAIENPAGIMSTVWRKPDQIIQPYQFGHPCMKRTCLWLKGLPPLIPTDVVDRGKRIRYPNGRIMSEWYVKSFNLSAKQRAAFFQSTLCVRPHFAPLR